jgi:hypothetical protein
MAPSYRLRASSQLDRESAVGDRGDIFHFFYWRIGIGEAAGR